jgi:uncharacterized protein
MRTEDFFEPMAYVTAKVTHGCNLKCKYCKVDSSSTKSMKMAMETAKRAARLLIENSRFDSVWFNMHGGEPLLMPDEWIQEIVEYGSDIAKKNSKEIKFPIATNGTLLTEERLLKLRSMGIDFSMSCDGPPETNDIMRKRGKTVLKTYELFKKHKIRVGIMAVISRGNYNKMKEVMDWYRQQGISAFLSNFVEAQGRGVQNHLLSPQEMYESGVQILDHMHETDISVANDDMLRKVVWFTEGRKHEDALCCPNVQCHAGRHMVAVDMDGSITVCGSADTSDFLIGRIDETIDDEQYKSVLNRFHDKGKWIIRCFDCPAGKICNHGCTTACNKSSQYRENMCQYTRMIWTHFCEHPEKPYHIDGILSGRKMKFMNS